MKNLILVVLLLLNFPSILKSADNIDGVMGIKFGLTVEQVKQQMSQKSDFQIELDETNLENLIYTNGKFAGRDVNFISFDFVDNQLYKVTIVLKVDFKSQIIDIYESVRDDLNQKYFITDRIIEEYKYPYEAGDGFVESAIELGKAKFATAWLFKNTLDSNFSNSILLSISTSFDVFLIYSEGRLKEIVTNRENKKNMSDY